MLFLGCILVPKVLAQALPEAPPTPTIAPVVVVPPIGTTVPSIAPGTQTWLFDAQVTEVGKRAERARQFISWVLKHQAIDNHRVFMDVWKVTLGVTLALTILVVAVLGLGLVVARKQDISVKVDVMPILIKVATMLLYAIFSYVIVLGLIQITELITAFFTKFLGGDKLFSIFFSADPTGDQGYIDFVGQRNMDPLANESAKTSIFLIEVSSYTYFAMGIMILLRKIVLWFLLILSPILALLMPFRFIRNAGWIWIGVFFQWAFYGPLFGIFLWALNKIWEVGIPFAFDFSRILSQPEGVYPLAINILYGGPQQVAGGLGQALSHQSPLNTSSYIDTFAEYVISLLMLWVAILLPWLLLRIFRDYCCDGIYAMKNILMNMLGASQRSPDPSPGLTPALSKQINQAVSSQMYQHQDLRQQQIISQKENIKNVKTEEISRRMDVSVSKLSDITKLETQSDKRQNANRVMQYMQNPMSAENKQDRVQFSRLKTELSQRAASGDLQAKRLLEATTSSAMLIRNRISDLAKTQADIMPITQKISVELSLGEDKVKQIASSFAQALASQQSILQAVSDISNVESAKVKQVITSVPGVVESESSSQVLNKLSQESGLNKEQTKEVLSEAEKQTENEEVVSQVAQKESSTAEQVKKINQKVFKAAGQDQPESGPAKQAVSIEEYEEMRSMWVDHYVKGEVPISETIKDRATWVKEESVRLENVLNKIASENEEIRASGLQEVADIIPFFILGDMSIKDIAIYLKAKLTASKDVSKNLAAEKNIKDRLADNIEYVELDRKKTQPKAEVLKKTLTPESSIDKKQP